MCDKVAVINKGKIVKIEEIGKEKQDEESEETVISVQQLQDAEKILKANNYETKIVDDKVVVKIAHDKVSAVIKLLAKNDIDVYSAVPKEKTLEDIFFDATEDKSEK